MYESNVDVAFASFELAMAHGVMFGLNSILWLLNAYYICVKICCSSWAECTLLFACKACFDLNFCFLHPLILSFTDDWRVFLLQEHISIRSVHLLALFLSGGVYLLVPATVPRWWEPSLSDVIICTMWRNIKGETLLSRILVGWFISYLPMRMLRRLIFIQVREETL